MTMKGPLWTLKPSTIELLSIELNSKKEILTEEGHLRDWRGLAELSGLSNLIIQKIGDSENPTKELLTQWKKTTNVNIENFLQYLEVIDRFDVIDDNIENIKRDVVFAHKSAQEKGFEIADLDTEAGFNDYGKEALTYEDLNRLHMGLHLTQYDAFILYGDDDHEFALELLNNLENQGLKVCITDRDLLGGAFEQEAVMKLIAERCRKLVPIFSPSFFNSQNNKFLTTFAQHVSVEKCARSLIPVLYKICTIPYNLSIYHKLVYKPDNILFNFWAKLTDSIKPGIYKEIEENVKDKQYNLGAKGKEAETKYNINVLESQNEVEKVIEHLPESKQILDNIIKGSHTSSYVTEATCSQLEPKECKDSLLPREPKDNLTGKIRKILKNRKSKKKIIKEACLS